MTYQKYTNEEIKKLLEITNKKIEYYKEEYYIYESIYHIYEKDKSQYTIKAQYMYYLNIYDKLEDDYKKKNNKKIIKILKSIMDKIFYSSNGKHQYIDMILKKDIFNIVDKINDLLSLYKYYFDYKVINKF